MATNEVEAPPEPAKLDQMMTKMGLGIARVADTQSGIPLRVLVMLIGIAVVVATAPYPANVVGTVLLVALALTLGSRSRRT